MIAKNQLLHHLHFSVDPKSKPSIYFGTTRGLNAYSLETLQTNKIVNSGEWLYGVTYDSIASKVYFSSFYKIYRANLDGSHLETVLSTSECKLIEH